MLSTVGAHCCHSKPSGSFSVALKHVEVVVGKFKAKHNEVIDLAGVHSSRKQTNKQQKTSQPPPQSNQPQPPRPDLCWQPPPPPPMHVGNLETSVHGATVAPAEVKISQQQQPPQSQGPNNGGQVGGHLPMNVDSTTAPGVLTSTTVNEDTTVQGTSQMINKFRGNFIRILSFHLGIHYI